MLLTPLVLDASAPGSIKAEVKIYVDESVF